MRRGGIGLLLAVALLFSCSGSVVGQPTTGKSILTRVLATPGGRWQEGNLVILTRDSLVLSRSQDRRVVAFGLRDLAMVEVSTRSRVSAPRIVAGFLGGAVLGSLGGALVGAYKGRGVSG